MLVPELKDLTLKSVPSKIYLVSSEYSIEINSSNAGAHIEDEVEYYLDIRAKDTHGGNEYVNINWNQSNRPPEFQFLYDLMKKNNVTYFLTFREVPRDIVKQILEAAFPVLGTNNYELGQEKGGIITVNCSCNSAPAMLPISSSLPKKTGVCPECKGTGIIDTGFYTRQCLNPGYHE